MTARTLARRPGTGSKRQGRLTRSLCTLERHRRQRDAGIAAFLAAVGGGTSVDLTPAAETDAAQALSFSSGGVAGQGPPYEFNWT